jgi:hypothetical protein
MTTTAKFSNGQTRIYSGSVSTIACMITIGDKVQKIGLSRNMETAEKSSRSYMTNGIDLYYGNFPEDVRDEVKFDGYKYDYTSIDSVAMRPLSLRKKRQKRGKITQQQLKEDCSLQKSHLQRSNEVGSFGSHPPPEKGNTMKYKLNISRDVDAHPRTSFGYSGNDGVDYMLTLPVGFCIWESGEHTAGFDSMSELRAAIKKDVMQCDCPECGR